MHLVSFFCALSRFSCPLCDNARHPQCITHFSLPCVFPLRNLLSSCLERKTDELLAKLLSLLPDPSVPITRPASNLAQGNWRPFLVVRCDYSKKINLIQETPTHFEQTQRAKQKKRLISCATSLLFWTCCFAKSETTLEGHLMVSKCVHLFASEFSKKKNCKPANSFANRSCRLENSRTSKRTQTLSLFGNSLPLSFSRVNRVLSETSLFVW